METVNLHWKRLESVDKRIEVIYRLRQILLEQNVTLESYLELESKYLGSLRSKFITYKVINYKKV